MRMVMMLMRMLMLMMKRWMRSRRAKCAVCYQVFIDGTVHRWLFTFIHQNGFFEPPCKHRERLKHPFVMWPVCEFRWNERQCNRLKRDVAADRVPESSVRQKAEQMNLLLRQWWQEDNAQSSQDSLTNQLIISWPPHLANEVLWCQALNILDL